MVVKNIIVKRTNDVYVENADKQLKPYSVY